MPTLPPSTCRRCGTPKVIPTDPDGLCERCLIAHYGFDPDDSSLYVGTLRGEEFIDDGDDWSGFSQDWIGRSVDRSPIDGRPVMTFSYPRGPVEIFEILVRRAYSETLPFYLEVTWTPGRGLRHALLIHPDAGPGVWGQLPRAQLLLAFLVGASKYGRGRPPLTTARRAELRQLADDVDALLQKLSYLKVPQALARIGGISIDQYYDHRAPRD